MSSKSSWRTALVVALVAITALACKAAEGLLTGGVLPPDSVSARPLGLASVRVDWSAAPTPNALELLTTGASGLVRGVLDLAKGGRYWMYNGEELPW